MERKLRKGAEREVVKMQFTDLEYTIGDKVYITSRRNGIKPYSVLTITGLSFSNGDTVEYILRDESNVYRLQDTDNLRLYKGQDLKKQRTRDIVIFALELAILLYAMVVLWFIKRF